MAKIIAIRRDAQFSPNSEAKDLDILQDVSRLVGQHYGVDVPIVDELPADEEAGNSLPGADIYITMGRQPSTLAALRAKELKGCVVVNSSTAVANCQRSRLERLMRDAGIAMPPSHTPGHATWLKRGDAAAQGKDDVVFCPDDESLRLAIGRFRARGITDYVTSAHIEGDVVKFYGVGNAPQAPSNMPQALFRCFYPTDDGISKFGDESINGKAHHYPYDKYALASEVCRLARLTGAQVYGGDAIVDSGGRFHIIDFNDWPSFSRCRDEAARAIAGLITRL